jgi:hypothetical protein
MKYRATLTRSEHRLVDATIGHQATTDGRRICTRCRESFPWTPSYLWHHAQLHMREDKATAEKAEREHRQKATETLRVVNRERALERRVLGPTA